MFKKYFNFASYGFVFLLAVKDRLRTVVKTKGQSSKGKAEIILRKIFH